MSVGETAAAAPLIEALLDRPASVLLTVATPTGANKAKQIFGARVVICYLPLDTPGATRRFLARIQPRLGVIIETEIWPNLLYNAWRSSVPIIYANARLSAGSFAGYRRARRLLCPLLATTRLIATQTPDDAKRFHCLAPDAGQIKCIGNLKYDANPLPPDVWAHARTLRARLGRGPIVLGASTHPGEEAILLDAFACLREAIPDAQLLIAPRHPERFDQAVEYCHERGFNVARTSTDNAQPLDTAVVVGDEMGALTRYYAAADVAVLGATFTPIGGHNPIEAFLAECPIIVGPYRARITEIVTAFEHALVPIDRVDNLAEQLLALIQSDQQRQTLSQRATKTLALQRGATERVLERIQALLDE